MKEDNVLSLIDPYYFSLYCLEGRDHMTETIPATELLSVFRFDFFAKIFYCAHRENSPFLARMVYLENLRSLNPMGYEYGKEKEKDSFRAHLRVLDSLIDSFSTEGFDPTVSIVPLAGNGRVFDGAQRVSVLAWAHKNVTVCRFPGTVGPSFDYTRFTSTYTSEFSADLTALEAINWLAGIKAQLSLVCDNGETMPQLKQVLYSKLLKLSKKECCRFFPTAGVPLDPKRTPATLRLIFYIPDVEDEDIGNDGIMISDPAMVKGLAELTLSRKGRASWRSGGGLPGKIAAFVEDATSVFPPFARFLFQRFRLRKNLSGSVGRSGLHSYSYARTGSNREGTMAVSVIVPVYNSESFLRQCLDSVAAQTFSNFEVILVDDGSTDSSGKICDEYVASDSRFRVIHQKNQGVSSARNVGLDNASGEYVFFMDSDDSIEPETLDHLYSAIKCGDYDISLSGFIRICSDKTIQRCFNPGYPPERLEGEEVLRMLILGPGWVWRTCWNKLIRRDLATSVKFEPVSQEDFLFCARLYSESRRIIYLNESLYHYFDRENSLSKHFSYIGIHKTLLVHWKLLLMTSEDRPGIRAMILSKMYKRILTSTFSLRHSDEATKEDLEGHKRLCDEILRGSRSEFYTHPFISVKDKVVFAVLRLCPWLLGTIYKDL